MRKCVELLHIHKKFSLFYITLFREYYKRILVTPDDKFERIFLSCLNIWTWVRSFPYFWKCKMRFFCSRRKLNMDLILIHWDSKISTNPTKWNPLKLSALTVMIKQIFNLLKLDSEFNIRCHMIYESESWYLMDLFSRGPSKKVYFIVQ